MRDAKGMGWGEVMFMSLDDGVQFYIDPLTSRDSSLFSVR